MTRLALVIALLASPLAAQDFSEGSLAQSWRLKSEAPARFKAKVVDILCTFTGDCPDDCGSKTRQLGLLRQRDGVLVLPLKNAQSSFSGAAIDLAPFCGQTITADGLMLEDPARGATNLYLLQTITTPDGKTVRADDWSENWARENPQAAGKGPWFRRDPRINEVIEREGYLGLGLDADKTFIDENF